jgi:CheY-like chemotaxis protein
MDNQQNQQSKRILLHADPIETTLDTAHLSDRLALDVASERTAVLTKVDDNTDIDIVIIDDTIIDIPGCKRFLDRLAGHDVAVVLLTAADPGYDLFRSGVDAYLSAPVDAAALVRTIERLQKRDTAGDDETTHEHSRDQKNASDRVGSSVATKPLYRRYPREFYGLWFLAAVTYGVGDIVSTVLAVFTDPDLVEFNPVVSVVLAEYGIAGFLAVKIVILVTLLWISVGGARSNDRFTYYWPPAVATALGIALTGWNLWLLYGGG